ncbi:fNIP repeat-containing protein [Clostridium sp. CAG:710]|nr:fNIP repeat-containing protein [Clostridium sp. CAG:710]
MISDDGTLLSYDRSCGTDNVVIPAKINNIPVKRVAIMAFASTGAIAQTSTGESIYIFKNEEDKTKYIEISRKEGSTDEEINEIMKTSYIYGSSELSTLKLKTAKEYALESDQKFKVYKDSSNTIKIEKASTDYNMIYFSSNSTVYPYEYYCTTNDVCDLLKEHLRSKDPARNYGITDNSYYEYLYPYEIIPNTSSSHRFGMLNNLEYISFYGLSNQYGVFKTLDFSQAIYIEELSSYATVMLTSDDSGQLISKVILPPNIKTIDLPCAKEVIFPSNSITEVIFPGPASIESIVFPKTLKAIGNNAFQGKSLTSVVIPSSVVRIGENAFAAKHLGQGNIASLKFEKDSHLIAIYGDERNDYDEGAFGRNKLSNVIIPKSVEYIGYHAFAYNNLTTVSFEANSKLKYMDSSVFWGNSNPINLTLTTPTDLSNWPAGTNDNITVVYER